MRTCYALLLLSLVLATNSQGRKHTCGWSWWIRVNNGTVMENGSLLSLEDGEVYPGGTFWLEEKRKKFYACPCLIVNCIQICENGLRYLGIRSTLFVDSKRSKITVWDENNGHTLVTIEDHFEIVHQNESCLNPQLLKPEEDERDRFQLLSNGSLYFPPSKDARVPRMMRHFHFCIIPMVEPDEIARVVICRPRERFKDMLRIKTAQYFDEYTADINSSFLLLIVIAYFLSADLKNLHGRAVACYAACLLLEEIYHFYRESNLSNIFGSKASAYFFYYIVEASMFWLNVICIDIYQTFKGFLIRRREVNFIYPSLYAWGGPALLTIIVLILNQTLPLHATYEYCWRSESWCYMIYVNGPPLILLSVNLVLFCLTLRKLFLQRRETQRAFGDTTSGRVNARDNDQFKLYLKLFLLMAITSVSMIVSVFLLAFSEEYVWYFDPILIIIDNTQGPIFFYICIWSRENVRNQVIATLTCCRKKPKEVLQMTSSTESSTKGITNVSTINITSVQNNTNACIYN